MATSRRLQLGIAGGFVLLASTAACQQNKPEATIIDPVLETPVPPVTSLVTITTPPVTIPLAFVDDCVEFVQFAAYVGVEDMVAMWDAAGQSIERLRENCISLGKGDPDALEALSKRRDELEAFFGVTTTVSRPGVATSSTG